jgi:hypothetical protein
MSLASTLFVGLDDPDLWRVVEEAESIAWMAANTPSSQS